MSNDISKYWISSLIKKCFDKRDSYSTTEHKVGTWIDGKPIYRKVLKDFITLDSSTQHLEKTHGIENIENTISCIAIENSGVTHPSAYAGSFYYIPSFDLTNCYFDRSNASGRSGRIITYVLEYTKTTD